MFKASKVARELDGRKRQYPEAWRIGENMAEDRFETIRGEDRSWSTTMLDGYVREVATEATQFAEALARSQGAAFTLPDYLSTIGIACGYTIEPALRNYLDWGAAPKTWRLAPPIASTT